MGANRSKAYQSLIMWAVIAILAVAPAVFSVPSINALESARRSDITYCPFFFLDLINYPIGDIRQDTHRPHTLNSAESATLPNCCLWKRVFHSLPYSCIHLTITLYFSIFTVATYCTTAQFLSYFTVLYCECQCMWGCVSHLYNLSNHTGPDAGGT